MKPDFLFHISDISCSCHGIEEFVENAYGQADYDMVSMTISIYAENKSIAYLSVNSFGGIRISTDSRVMLEQIVNLLENTSLNEAEANDPISVAFIGTQIKNDGVIVQGSSNTVANNHGKIEIEGKTEEPAAKTFWMSVLQNITSNYIWYLLSVVVGSLVTYYLTN